MRELPAAADATERLLALHARNPGRYPVLLDSAATGGPLGRYSILMAAPGERLTLESDGRLDGPGTGQRFCDRLNGWWRSDRGPAAPAPWPFAGGWFLYLGYELAQEIEPTLRLPVSPLPIVALAWRMRAALLHDHANGRNVVMAEPGAEADAVQLAADFEAARADAAEAAVTHAGALVEDDPKDYLEACRRALEHIAAGDVYQANLARRWRVPLPRSLRTADLYRSLRAANPGAFAGSAALPGFSVLSSSPERLVRVRGREVDTRPIAGTRPRSGQSDTAAIAAFGETAERR